MSELTAPPTFFEFDNSFARDLTELYVDWQAATVPKPELVAFNEELAVELGVDPEALRSSDGVAVLAGNASPPGAAPIAMAYAGHQFGGYAPRLGDGRALLLGEVIDPQGIRRDIHLKGSGRTPFARGGDGKAALAPMLREFLIAEAMHALRVPTTRSLSVVATGEEVAARDTPTRRSSRPRGGQPSPSRHVRVRGTPQRPRGSAAARRLLDRTSPQGSG